MSKEDKLKENEWVVDPQMKKGTDTSIHLDQILKYRAKSFQEVDFEKEFRSKSEHEQQKLMSLYPVSSNLMSLFELDNLNQGIRIDWDSQELRAQQTNIE